MSKFVFLILLFSLKLTASVQDPSNLAGENIITGKPESVLIDQGKIQGSSIKGTVVLFLSAKCPCSDSHVDLVKNLATEFKDFQFVAFHSNADESKKDARTYFKSINLNFPILSDQEAKWADHFKAYKTPHSFILNTAGEIIYQGGVTNSSHGKTAEKVFLKQALREIADGKPVTEKMGRTLGCVILRKDEL